MLDGRALAGALASTDLRLVALATAPVLVCLVAGCVRLWALVTLAPARRRIALGDAARVYLAACAGQQVLPAPAGELLRARALARGHGVPLRALLLCHAAEKAVDVAALAICLAPLAFAAAPPVLRRPLLVAACVAAALPAAVALCRAGWRSAVALALAAGVAEHLAHALSIAGLAGAAHAVLPAGGCLVAVGATRLAGLVPAAPGQLGVAEAALAGALRLYGVPIERALALALLYRVAHAVPALALGLPWWRRLAAPAEAAP